MYAGTLSGEICIFAGTMMKSRVDVKSKGKINCMWRS